MLSVHRLLLREVEQTLDAFLMGLRMQPAVRLFGGQIFVAGGFLQLVNCRFARQSVAEDDENTRLTEL